MDDELEDTQLRKLKAAYARIRVCSDVRRHAKPVTLEEIEHLEKEALEAYEERVRKRDESTPPPPPHASKARNAEAPTACSGAGNGIRSGLGRLF